MEELSVIEEKFTRCPQCQSFSLKVSDELSPNEKLKSMWVPVTVFKCNNCSYRYVEFGKFSDTLKRIFFSLIGRVERKWLLVAVPAAVIVILAGLFWLLPGGTEKPGNHIQPPPVDNTPIVKTEDTVKENTTPEDNKAEDPKSENTDDSKIDDQTKEEKSPEDDTPPVDQPGTEQTQTEQTEQKPDKPVQEQQPPETQEPEYTYIVLGNSNRFGVNWNTVAGGVQISRLSDGPLKQAGIRIGDTLSEVDGTPITNGNRLLQVRNRIFNGRKDEAVIKVVRDGEIIYFKLVKKVKEPAESTDSESSSAKVDPAPLSQAVKVFAQTSIKIRSSAPDRVSPSLKWSYSQKEINVRRSDNQRVWIAGDRTGNGKWAVDDQLIINGKAFDGLTQLHDRESGLLPEWTMCKPLDITSLVPPEKDTKLKIELADHGKRWGNTDIYIIVKPGTESKSTA